MRFVFLSAFLAITGCDGNDSNSMAASPNNAGSANSFNSGQQTSAGETNLPRAGSPSNAGSEVPQTPSSLAGSMSVTAGDIAAVMGGQGNSAGSPSSGGSESSSTNGMMSSVSGVAAPIGGLGASIGGREAATGGMDAEVGGIVAQAGAMAPVMGGIMIPQNPNEPAVGLSADSCGAPDQGLQPVDCTARLDFDAQCIMGNHCSCSPGFRCLSNRLRPGTRQCDPGSICIPDGPDGSRPDSCGSPDQGLIPVDCTINGDVNAICVFGNHCMCSVDFECEETFEPGIQIEECKAGSVCVPR